MTTPTSKKLNNIKALVMGAVFTCASVGIAQAETGTSAIAEKLAAASIETMKPIGRDGAEATKVTGSLTLKGCILKVVRTTEYKSRPEFRSLTQVDLRNAKPLLSDPFAKKDAEIDIVRFSMKGEVTDKAREVVAPVKAEFKKTYKALLKEKGINSFLAQEKAQLVKNDLQAVFEERIAAGEFGKEILHAFTIVSGRIMPPPPFTTISLKKGQREPVLAMLKELESGACASNS